MIEAGLVSFLLKRESALTPLIRLPAIRASHELEIRRYTRADFAGSLDGFRLRWCRLCAQRFFHFCDVVAPLAAFS
jgi:hypothetical protein